MNKGDLSAQQQIVAYWKFCEAQGLRPSIRSCIAHLRMHDVKIDERNASRFLAAFSAKSPHPKNTRSYSSTEAAQPQHTSSTQDEGFQHSPSTPPAQPQHLRAQNKVPLVSKNTASQSPTLFAPAPKPDKRSATEITADSSLSMLRPRIEPILKGMTWGEWRKRNRRYAIDMAQAGMDADEIDMAHRDLSDQRAYVIWRLDWVQESLTKPKQIDLNEPPAFLTFLTPEQTREWEAKILAKRASEKLSYAV